MNVTVDQGLCGGCGNCASVASSVFELDPATQTARVLRAEVAPADQDAVANAEEECPFGAITIK